MRFIAFIRLFKTIFNKKRLPNLAWIEKQGLLFVKIAQTFALRIYFLTPETTLHLQKLYTHASIKFHTIEDIKKQLPENLLLEIQ